MALTMQYGNLGGDSHLDIKLEGSGWLHFVSAQLSSLEWTTGHLDFNPKPGVLNFLTLHLPSPTQVPLGITTLQGIDELGTRSYQGNTVRAAKMFCGLEILALFILPHAGTCLP